MSRYIDADALIIGIKENNLGEWYVGRIDGKSEEVIPTDTVYKIIDSAPSIDIKPKRGERILCGTYTNSDYNVEWYAIEATCNLCGERWMGNRNFCPNCGAKMK